MTALTLRIHEVAYGGKGVARTDDGKVCFLSGVLPGETVKAHVIREHESYSDACALEIVTASPHRIAPVCPLAFACARHVTHSPSPISHHPFPISLHPFPALCCPGCSYQHLVYEEEVRLKQAQLAALLTRPAGCDTPVLESPVAAPTPMGYRNKLSFHAQKDGRETRLGYFAEDNLTVIDVPACPLGVPALNDRLAALRQDRSFLHGLRDGMTLTFRHTERDLAVWWRGEAHTRDTWLVETTVLGPLSVPRGSFFQVNPAVADLLLGTVMDRLAEWSPRMVVDLYCGVGVFALAAAKAGVPDVVGIDIDGPGIAAAGHNARKLGLTGIRWVTASAQKALAGLAPSGMADDAVLIVDPPRTGLGRPMVRDILRCLPRRIIYVSCAPDTMVRDVTWLREGGYRPTRSQLFDMFPRTAHFESVTVLSR